MTARDVILARIRRAVDQSSDQADRKAAAEARIAAKARNLVPDRGTLDPAARVDLFQAQAEAVQATVARVSSSDDIPEEVAHYLRQHNLPQALRHGDDELISGLPWRDKTPSLEVSTGRADPKDEVSVSHAFAGVAETGTLVLTSGADNPTTLNFLPENHIVVVNASNIDGAYEDIWPQDPRYPWRR